MSYSPLHKIEELFGVCPGNPGLRQRTEFVNLVKRNAVVLAGLWSVIGVMYLLQTVTPSRLKYIPTAIVWWYA